MSDLPYLQDLFQLLRMGHHLSPEDGPIFSAVTGNYEAYASQFALLGLKLARHRRDFFYFEPDANDGMRDTLPRIAVFSFILVDHLANAETRMAQPLSTMERVNRNEDMRRLRELVREQGVKQIVVGLPLRLDGTRGEMAEEVERFAQRVRKQIGVPVEMVDERLTSWEAERLMEEVQGRFIHDEKLTESKKSKNVPVKMTVDAVAAAVILKEYLDRQGRTAEKV